MVWKKGTSWGRLRSSLACLEWQPKLSKSEASRPSCPREFLQHSRQARDKTGFDASQFLIDWQAEQATCPERHISSSWTPAIDNRTNEVIKIKFSTTDCQACPSLRLCTQSTRHVRRPVTFRPKEQYDALQARRELETTQDFKALYATGAGVEGTISQGVRTMGLRRSRYIGQERTQLQHVATAAAINVVRLMRWLNGEPHAKTRQSPLVQLLRPAA